MKKTIAAIILFSVQVIFAFAPGEFSGFGWDKTKSVNYPPDEASTDALFDLVEKTGVAWVGRWNPETGLPEVLFSDGYSFEAVDSADLVAKCYSFIDENPGLFGQLGRDELWPLSVQKRLGIWFVHFEQRLGGLRVEGATAGFRVKNGKLAFFKAELLPGLRPSSPALSSAEAASALRGQFDFDEYSAESVYFAPAGGRLAWRITAEQYSPRHRWIAYIDASSGEILAAYDDIRLWISGKTRGNIHLRYGREDPIFDDLSYLYILVDGFLADTSGLDGSFSADIPPATGWTIGGKLEGIFCKSIPIADTPADIYFPADSAEMDIVFQPPAADLDEINGYYHINKVHNWVKAVEPEFTGMDYQVICYVRETEPPCPNNAFWDGTSVHMGAGAGSYDNWGYYADVYYHEYGHGITDKQYPPGMLPYIGESGAIDEAVSDYTACTITDEPEIGEGGLSPYGRLRTMENTLQYPDDIEDEVHADGSIIGGCFWDLRVALGATYTDTLIHFAKYGFPEQFEAFLDEVILADDDDGNILNGTPNFMAIYEAFQGHGIGSFHVNIYHRALLDSENPAGPYTVQCIVASSLPPDPGSVKLGYSTDGGATWPEIPMAPTGFERQFSAEIPGTGMDTEVLYYISACDTIGICATLPALWPTEYFSFRVGTDTTPPTISHRPIADAPIEAAPFKIAFRAEDNLGIGRAMVIWRVNDSEPETVDVLPDSLGDCLGEIMPCLLSVGDSIFYKILVLDGAMAANSVSSPIMGEHAFAVVRSIWLDFEFNSGGVSSASGWQWGIPREDVGAHSGEKCWGTELAEDYRNNANYVMRTADFNVVGWNSATMEMWSFWGAERTFDGGFVRISSDGGVRWYDIQPVGGYPLPLVAATGRAGFSGYSEGWRKVIFDLTPFMAGDFDLMSFEFVFKSDEAGTGPGWYIDDIAVLERQIVLPPYKLTAESGWNGRVPLTWATPDPASTLPYRARPAGFTGYNIYRAELGSDFGETPINAIPIADTSYFDTDVTNEIRYLYRVTAVYDDKESEPTAAVEAMPFNAIASITPDSLHLVRTTGSAAFDTSLVIANLGSGGLDFEIAEHNEEPGGFFTQRPSPDFGTEILSALRSMAEDGLFDALSSAPLVAPSPTEWRFLMRDPNEPLAARDIRDVFGQHNATNVWFKFDSWLWMGDPDVDFVGGFGIDVDQDPSTGSPDFFGVEYLVAVGALPLPMGAVILRYNPSSSYGWDLAGTPHWIMKTGDSLGVGITKAQIGEPAAVFIYAAIISEFTGVPVIDDQAPDAGLPPVTYIMSDAWWISESPINGTVFAGEPQSVNLHIDVPSMALGEHRAWLTIATNDRANSNKTVPITCRIVPVGIDEAKRPTDLTLCEPFPNPFNSAFRVDFTTPGGELEIALFDMSGRRVGTVFSGTVSQGRYKMTIDARTLVGGALPSGVYSLRIASGEKSASAKVIYVK